MIQKNTIRVHLDRNILSRSYLAKPEAMPKEIRFGPHVETVYVSGYKTKIQKDINRSWVDNEVECLPTIAALAEQGKVALFCSDEVKNESFRSVSNPSIPYIDIFHYAKIHDTCDAIEKSYIFSMGSDNVFDKSVTIQFCKWLQSLSAADAEKIVQLLTKMPANMRENFRDLERFRELCRNVDSDEQMIDAFHLWTAEAHKADFFLSLDKKFINCLRKSSKINFVTPIVYPSELVEYIGCGILRRLSLEDRSFYYLIDLLK